MTTSALSPSDLSDQDHFPFPATLQADSPSQLLRRTAEKDFDTCVEAAWSLHKDSTVLQQSAEMKSSKCNGQGTKTAECVYKWDEDDLAAHKEACRSLQGEQVTFEELVIVCRARHSRRQNGFRLVDTITYVHVPDCFPKDDCQDHYNGICLNYEDHVAKYWAGVYREKDYYSISCQPKSEGCVTTYDAGLSTGAIVGIVLACVASVGVLAGAFVLSKRKTASGDGQSANANEGSNAGPKAGFGLLKGWRRDRHLKHTVLWAANVVWLVLWIVFTAQGCKLSRYGSGCDIDSPNWFWIENTWMIFLIWAFLFIPFLVEFYNSSTRKYLSNINTTESLLDYMQRLYRTAPTLSLRMECYHMETRTVNYTDANGRTQTRTETYPVVTYVESENVNIVSWEDRSANLQNSDISEYQVTKVTVTKTFVADANYEAQRTSLVERNRYRDVHHNLIVNYNVPGYKDKMLSYVDLEKKPAFLNITWCWLAHLTILFAFPYRLWMSGVTGKIDTNVHKSLQTRR